MIKKFLSVCAASLLACGVMAVPARAASRPSAAWALSTYYPNASTKVVATYAVHRVGKHDRVTLQRSVGSSMKRFSQVTVLRAATVAGTVRGTKTFTAPAVGRYRYRVVIFGPSKHGHRPVLRITSSRTLYSYGPVALSTYYGSDSSGDTIEVGGHLLRYISASDNGYTGGGGDSSTCKSIRVTAGIPDDEAPNAVAGTLTIVEEEGDGGTLNVPTYQIVAKTIAVAHGAWQFAVAVNGEAGIYWNGTLSCWTRSGT